MSKKLPDVYITNAALAHSPAIDRETFFHYFRNSTAVKFWKDNKHSTAVAKKIYQTARDMQGKRNVGDGWSAETFRQTNQALKEIYVHELKFLELDEWLLTAAKILTEPDGWHFGGLPKLMEAMIYLNMLCNND